MGALYGLVLIGRGSPRGCVRFPNQMVTIINVAQLIRVETGRYPASIAEMVFAKDSDGVPLMGSLDEILTDPWGRDYECRLLDGKPSVRCLGADGTPGGEGDDADPVRTLDDG